MLGWLVVCLSLMPSSLALAAGIPDRLLIPELPRISLVLSSPTLAAGLSVAIPSAAPAELGKGKLLVAARELADPHFAQSVVLLLGYGRLGALGVIINHPTTVRLSEILPDSFRTTPLAGVVYRGGPVAPTVMLLLFRAERQLAETEHVFADVYLSDSQTLTEDKIAQGSTFRIYAGHAGWAPGQLDNEVARGDWYIVPADTDTVFRKPAEHIWSELIQRSTGRWVNLLPPLSADHGPRPKNSTPDID